MLLVARSSLSLSLSLSRCSVLLYLILSTFTYKIQKKCWIEALQDKSEIPLLRNPLSIRTVPIPLTSSASDISSHCNLKEKICQYWYERARIHVDLCGTGRHDITLAIKMVLHPVQKNKYRKLRPRKAMEEIDKRINTQLSACQIYLGPISKSIYCEIGL